ncbi:MAG: class I SAM-dependent methyltransferase, partial [candidate division WOR-3 bacterium]
MPEAAGIVRDRVPGPSVAVQFSRFAPYYDRFMSHYVDYPGWVRYVQRIFYRYRQTPRVILDLACGTGIPTLLLAQKGYRIIGIDRSPAMLDVLRPKIRDYDVQLIEADIRDFHVPEPADAGVCLYDSMNYLLTCEDLMRCFRAARESLRHGSLFVFDMNTIYGLATYWGNRTVARNVDKIQTIWRTDYDPDSLISTLHLTFYVTEGGRLVRYDEIHEERAYEMGEVAACLAAAGFREADFFAHG